MTASNAFQQLIGESYINLATLRKSGQEMRTPVWFVAVDGELYIRTNDNSGKVKRIRRNPVVRVAPCTASGALKGEWLPGSARLASADEAAAANQAYNKKYGLQKHFFDIMNRVRGNRFTTLAVRLDE